MGECSRLGRFWDDELTAVDWGESGALRLKNDEIEGWFLGAEDDALGAIVTKVDARSKTRALGPEGDGREEGGRTRPT